MTQTLRRVTTQFVPQEDRIRIAGVLESGPSVVVWLTRRLLGLLLPVLVKRLDEQFSLDSPAHRQVMQEFAQQAARNSFESSAPVLASIDSEVMLATSADVMRVDFGISLVFRDDGDRAYSLPLNSDALRQWLQIVHKAHRKADWQLPLWPAWLTGSDAAYNAGLPVH